MMRKLGLAAVAVALFLGTQVYAQSGLRQVPLGFCSVSSLGSAVKLTATNCVFGSFTGVIAGTNLTVSSLTGSIVVGQPLVGSGIAAGTLITGQTSGTLGQAGIYSINNSQTVGSESMTTAGVPASASYVVLCATSQTINYRDDNTAPTATPGSGGQFIPASQCIPYNGTITNLQFFQQAAGAVLGASFYQ